jgi:hypothetical protein
LLVADLAVGADGGRDRARARAGDELGDETDAADVRIAIFLREAEPFREVRPHFVAVERFDVQAAPRDLSREHGAQSGLSRTGQPRKPNDETTLRHFLRSFQDMLTD